MRLREAPGSTRPLQELCGVGPCGTLSGNGAGDGAGDRAGTRAAAETRYRAENGSGIGAGARKRAEDGAGNKTGYEAGAGNKTGHDAGAGSGARPPPGDRPSPPTRSPEPRQPRDPGLWLDRGAAGTARARTGHRVSAKISAPPRAVGRSVVSPWAGGVKAGRIAQGRCPRQDMAGSWCELTDGTLSVRESRESAESPALGVSHGPWSPCGLGVSPISSGRRDNSLLPFHHRMDTSESLWDAHMLHRACRALSSAIPRQVAIRPLYPLPWQMWGKQHHEGLCWDHGLFQRERPHSCPGLLWLTMSPTVYSACDQDSFSQGLMVEQSPTGAPSFPIPPSPHVSGSQLRPGLGQIQ